MKKIYFNEAKDGIKKGIDKAANAIKATLGAKGRTVLIAPLGRPQRTTKDGVSVAREIKLSDPIESVGAELVKEASQRTADIVGDGTTTSALLVQAMASDALNKVDSGADPILIKAGMDKAVEQVVKHLKENAVQIEEKEDIKYVASISANDEEIGEAIADVFSKIGKDGVVSIESSPNLGLHTEVVNGLQIDKGYASGYFVTNDKMEAIVENCSVIITDQRINSTNEIAPLLTKAVEAGKNSFLVIADDFDESVLSTLILNKVRGGFGVVAIKAPSFGEKRKDHLYDISILTGANMISKSLGKDWKTAEVEDLGFAKKVVSKKDSTIIIDGGGTKEAVDKRIGQLKNQLSMMDSEQEKEDVRSRIAKLSGGVSVIRVGGSTETEVKEKKDRVEDAVCATKAALEEGIVVGGGISLLNAREVQKQGVGDESKGGAVVFDSLVAPFMTILSNAGENGSKYLDKVGGKSGYNAKTGKIEKDMLKAGIIDPVKVVRSCVEHSASVVGQLITSGAFIVEEKDEV